MTPQACVFAQIDGMNLGASSDLYSAPRGEEATHKGLKQPVQAGQLIVESPVEKPSAWMRDGQSPTEITLSVAILTVASLWGIALVIVAIAQLMKVLVPSSAHTSLKLTRRK